MSKIYRNTKTSVAVISGKVKSVAPDRKSFVISTQEWDKGSKSFENKEIEVQSSFAFEDDIQVGGIATAVGYFNGPASILAQSATVKSSVFETQDLAIVSGQVVKCGLNEEKNEDGSPKLKRDGTPRKPHYDVVVAVLDDEGRRVRHMVKVYNFADVTEGEKSNIDKIASRLRDFKNFEETPTCVTIVTTPGEVRSWESNFNGQVYQNFGCDHMGFKSLDVNYMYDRQAERGQAPAAQQRQSQAPVQPQPQPQAQPQAQAQQAQPQAPQSEPSLFGDMTVPAFDELPFADDGQSSYDDMFR